MKDKIVLVYSGGLDSTTVLYDLIDKGYEVVALSVNYGQRHSQELEKAEYFCKKLGVRQFILDLSNVNLFQNTALVNKNLEIKDGVYDRENIETTMVPNRNSILANYAIAVAMNEKAKGIALGIHSENPNSGEIEYPDCQPEFVKALTELAKVVDFVPYEVLVPFSGKSKIDVVTRGLELGVPYEETWSCYHGGEIACGQCATCRQRLDAFLENNAKDPIDYDKVDNKYKDTVKSYKSIV